MPPRSPVSGVDVLSPQKTKVHRKGRTRSERDRSGSTPEQKVRLSVARSVSRVVPSIEQEAEMKHLPTILSATLVAAVMLVAGAPAAVGEDVARSEEYVPFVTDFPRPATSKPAAEPFVPFVTDFPKPTNRSVTPRESTGGIDWAVVGIGGGVGAALAALLFGSWLVRTHGARPARS
jgi:hypothetical protein